MPDPTPQSIITANGDILASVSEQIKELHPGVETQAEVAAILKELQNLQSLGGVPGDTNSTILGDAISQVANIQNGTTTWQDSGGLLGDLDTLKNLVAGAPPDDPKYPIYNILASVITQIEELLNYRPDVASVLSDLDALKSLKGGPADAIAFHDFNVLQIAFENIWLHAFDKNLAAAVEKLYANTIQLYDDAGLEVPDRESIRDVSNLRDFIANVQSTILEPGVVVVGPPPISFPSNIKNDFPEAIPLWNYLSADQQSQIIQYAATYDTNNDGKHDTYLSNLSGLVDKILKNPDGTNSRIEKLILEIGEAISEPYAFDVFAPNSYNFGIMITYRQQWVPGPYQAGDLRATIPLAPGETRKYSKKTSVKTTRAAKEIEKSMSSRSDQSSVISRAEADIMQKTTTDTNFKMTADGSFKIGIGDIHASTEFDLKQAVESSMNKKTFHEATLKAAQEYRLERSMEVDTTTAIETEETTSGEISNPNNEITVTYLFYELQRRYTITEFIYRARPVILVAQEVPAPHEIDEAWLIEHQWILSRVLLDDTFRSALTYLNSGFAGDEVSIEVLKASLEKQTLIATALEAQVNARTLIRDSYRGSLFQAEAAKSLAEASQKQDVAGAASDILNPGNAFLASLTFGLSEMSQASSDLSKITDDQAKIAAMEANLEANKTRLQYTEQALADAQSRLDKARDAYQKATDQYTAALQQQFNRHEAIDQLRVHVKQNIIYYMQAIWDHEPPDQRYFRLYNLEITCPGHDQNLVDITIPPPPPPNRLLGGNQAPLTLKFPRPVLGDDKVYLKDLADLDNPLGFKGNYIIFPLKTPTILTTFMLQEFIDEYTGVRDPELYANFDIQSFDKDWQDALARNDANALAKLKDDLTKYLTVARRTTDEIIVPTGQLFIEALTGSHPLLEDFKLLHRVQDVRKVKAEVRHAELDNLRLASRLVAAQEDAKNISLLADVEKKIVVEGNATIEINKNA